MSDLISLNIDGKLCKAKEGESLLNIARANGIFIPAICYLTRCTPTLACRLCLVEADGKQVYACNAKAKEGMHIKTTTENIAKERRAIMEVYDVNHPLQCGVCDQSGECELQNYSLYMKVDSQSYSIKDVPRPTQHWGVMNYDPGLCIVCEKCVTVCKDMIGSNALSTVKRPSDAIEKTFKDSMPKDAYSMWNKLNKSLIGFEKDACTDCGECISVCPVGALVSNDFQYKSNAWELTRVPASNPHSSDCALMYYEKKHESVEKHNTQKIYRVTNDHHYISLNGAARFAYDFENKVESKNEKEFTLALEAFKKANSIKFNSFITNEEAFILQKLKEKYGFKLVNDDAFLYQRFIKEFSNITGKSLYTATLKDVHESNFVISVGSFLKHDMPNARYALNNSVILNKGSALYFHPLEDNTIQKIGKKGKTTDFIFHKPLKEEAILYFILDVFANENLPENIKEYLQSLKEKRVKTVVENIKEQVVEKVIDEDSGEEKEVTKMVTKKQEKEVEYIYSKLLDEIGKDETFYELIDSMILKKDKFSLIIGEDLITHPKWKSLAKLTALIEKYTQFDVLIIPSKTNTLGVSLICDLDEKIEGFTIGYNEKANYQLSALGDGNLDIPALNQQEGTFVNIDKKVVPTNAALPYKGYVLNDIANELLDEKQEYTIDYTKYLPIKKGFKNIEFDSLTNYFSNDRKENRGYCLENLNVEQLSQLSVISEFKQFEINENYITIYRANPINIFNEFVAVSHEFKDKAKTGLYISKDLCEELQLFENDIVNIFSNEKSLDLEVYIDKQLEGKIAYIPTFDKSIQTKDLFETYRFSKAKIVKV
ncbi:ferredoxin [Malaciobacter molluscorum LMG 25693]|uniref:Ferredoxin n=1 Tax=Malaciobacter molluscorum LMG 25693 TaxID=870501 RepID=A0A2G1DFJ6_9BACT|nr:NADH-quinone oxidoreductase subunit G [Malaciobacter molluscorum]AXX93578.1 NADH:quinone oxidoreductase I, chain G [Malaciobacter molluscorum LMG 25693]PHO17268.1 ferredoxin [Malaciobacter molluscorum LMG 25693]